MKSIFKTILPFTVSLVMIACSSKPEAVKEKEAAHEEHSNIVEVTKAQYDGIGIVVQPLSKKNLKNVVKASGFLKVPPQNQAHVASFISGMVKTIHVKAGDYVRQGQILASLEHPDVVKLQEDYVTSQSRLMFLEKEYERQKTLNQENAGIVKIFQQTESEYLGVKARSASLKSQITMLSLNLEDISAGKFSSAFPLRSPIDGYIAHIDASIGMTAEPSKSLFEIIDNSKIHVDLLVYEKDLFKVKIGQKVDFVLTNQDNRLITGVVFSMSKAFENETKSVAVHAEIKNDPTIDLIPGMFVTGFITVGDGGVEAVPEEAIVKSEGKEYIFVEKTESKGKSEKAEETKEEGHYHFTLLPVKTGTADLGYVQITPLTEIAKDSKIVAKGAFFLLSKMKEGEGGDEH
ncbi:MAG TPA: efflux RND transporter periplasmic adaptor subunit [Cyclobacteriaceae bacterium]|nr:efflux RND transporter periplasmic adaptor subunit [Cyclobacteriaceae bacterium]HMY95711.1 efflux RND transporter periplasmic adaptor subunit [Cyclobacteriaceae bacterium]HND44660.1 efflux RND transporter periplasmic adaptor subunit [Cyclobacteriaceae bacterium]HNH34082.1 efflux RND transporter periplasmic adaptor subunit [bacterium]HNH60416.1 efflux RND transporter periplasmic adaptor subunit [Cyclobacteriaceae bacterium]